MTDDLASEFDIAWKEALEWFFEPFMAFFFPEMHAEIDWTREPQFQDKELQAIAPEADAVRGTVDKLVKVWTHVGEESWVLIHIEVQSQRDADFARRLYSYNHRLADRYGGMPVSLAILGDDGPGWRPDRYEAGRWGCRVAFQFPAVKLLDYRSRESDLEVESNPFAAVVLTHLKAIETRGNPAARYDWKLRLLKGLYERNFTKLQAQRLFHVMDWVMKLPPVLKRQLIGTVLAIEKERTVPLLSPTEQMWQEDGIAIGLERGARQALHRETQRILKMRFGQPGLELMPLVEKVQNAAAIESFLDAVETAPDVDSLRKFLPTS